VVRVRAVAPIQLATVRGREERGPALAKRSSPRDKVEAALPPGMARAGRELRLVRTGLEPELGDNLQVVYAEPRPRAADDRFPKERAKREARAVRALGKR
jgi:hypothetical protein